LTQKADQPSPNVGVSGGTGHTFNFITQAQVSRSFNSKVQWYQQEMLKHGVWYWIMHALVALAVVAFWEYRHWFFSLLQRLS
jgi:uncharacterized membrane protein YgdD (TMEM256/DUF423 family)